MKNPPSPEQIADWFESPAAEYFIWRLEKELDDMESARGIDVYHFGEPSKTQEVLANLNGTVETLGWILRQFKEGQIDEWNSPERE